MDRWRRLIEILPQLIWTATQDGLADYFSPQASALTGMPPEAFLGWGWLDALHPDDRASAREEWSRAVAEGREYQAEQRFRRFDGEYRWFSCHGTPVRDADGKIVQWAAVSIDVTERKRAEDRAQSTRRRLELVMRLSRSSFWEVAVPDGDFLRGHIVRDDLMWVHGVEAASLVKVDVPTMFESVGVLPEDREMVSRAMQQTIDGETAELQVEYRSREADGTVRWRLARGAVTRDASGKPTAISGVGMDITDLKRMEQDAREAKERLDFGIRGSGVSIFDLEMPSGSPAPEASELTLVNFWESLGYDPAEMPRDRMSVTSLAVIPDDTVPTAKPMLDYLDGAIPHYAVERQFRRKDGTTKWVLARGTAVRDERGVAVRFFGTHVDITERKRMEEQLRESEVRWRSLTETLPQLIWTAATDGTIEYLSAQACNYTGLSERELLGDGWANAIHPDDLAQTGKSWFESVGQDKPHEVQHRLRRADGDYRWFTTRAEPARDANGRVFKWVGSSTDITALKLIEAELERERAAAERANRAKDEFLANVSHEIRTPMNAILGMTELALDSARTDHQRQLLSTVKSAAKNLLGIINDLLDFSKIAAGKLALDEADFGLRAEVGDTLRALAARAHRKGLELICHVHPDVPDALFGDAGRVRQVLMNLVGNALKFTAQGEVVVEVTLGAEATSAAEDVSLVFAIRDTGIGIARDKQAAIFHAFEQEDSTTTRRYGGTGLGLTISAQLATLMMGAIAVDSEPGRGSTFTFTARFTRSSRSDEPGAPSQERLEALRVLVVDDNETNRGILSEWLTNWRMRPTAVSNAQSAFEELDRGEATGAPYSLVLLDGRMPDVDGITLASQILERYGPSIRLILLSSDDSATLATRSREVGIRAYLLKPAQQSDLLETIWVVMNAPSGDAPNAGPTCTASGDLATSAGSTSLRILVAEDNDLNATLLKTLLGKRGHRAQFADDGRVALERATQSTFDLVLLDLHMPELDGFEVVRAIRERERTTGKHLPIIALTARSSSRDRERCLAAGMDDFLAKPIEADTLWAAVDRMVAVFPPRAPRQSRLLDARTILRACAGEADVFAKLREVFLRALPDHLVRVRSALHDLDLPRLAESAHKLFGTLGAFSTIAGAVALTIEDAARREDHESCAELVDQLDSMCAEILEDTRELAFEDLAL